VIGSLSLGVAREFRVRRVVARDGDGDAGTLRGDEEGQISIRLPHNSLLVMHAEMQEEWKHSVAPALAIDPHPVAGNRRSTCNCHFTSFLV
jgi:alkylated DNA repair dioxygenase AlkB